MEDIFNLFGSERGLFSMRRKTSHNGVLADFEGVLKGDKKTQYIPQLSVILFKVDSLKYVKI